MYNGRHCVYSDYKLLVNETNKILQLLKEKSLDECKSEVIKHLELVNRYDTDIMLKIRYHLNKGDVDSNAMIRVIQEQSDELLRNVVVDMNEHN